LLKELEGDVKMDNSEDPDKKLIPFLRNLADSIEKQELLPQQLQSIGEFFMSYQFQEQAIKDNDSSRSSPVEFEREDLLKFLILGWYCYCVILRDQRFPAIGNNDELE
jgi:hypothetical protein